MKKIRRKSYFFCCWGNLLIIAKKTVIREKYFFAEKNIFLLKKFKCCIIDHWLEGWKKGLDLLPTKTLVSTYVKQQKWSCQKTAIESRFSYDTRYIYGYFYFSTNKLEKQDTRFREAVPIEKRVAIRLLSCALWCSESANSYRTASKTFLVRKSTAVSIIVYRNILSNFRETQVEQPKQFLHLKKPLTVKILRLSVQFGLLELISHNPRLF